MSKKVLIIGAGGVGNVVVRKCAQAPEVFSERIPIVRFRAFEYFPALLFG